VDTAGERGAGAEHARRLPAMPTPTNHAFALLAFALGTGLAAGWAQYTFQRVAWPAPLLGGLALEMLALRKYLPARELPGSTGHCLDVALRQTLANLLVVLPLLWWRGLELFPGVWGDRWRAALVGPLASAVGVVVVHVLVLLAAKQAFFELGRKGTAA
jgi:hypothetical protein